MGSGRLCDSPSVDQPAPSLNRPPKPGVLTIFYSGLDLLPVSICTNHLHEERGRKPGHVVLARRGELTRITDGPKYKVLAAIGDNKMLRGVVNVARGPVMIQILNGQLISATIDEDTKNFVPEGVLGFPMHVGPPFKIEYRNVPQAVGEARAVK